MRFRYSPALLQCKRIGLNAMDTAEITIPTVSVHITKITPDVHWDLRINYI